MSTFLNTDDKAQQIKSIECLHGYFAQHSKPISKKQIGIECEVFGVHSGTGMPLPFSGERGIEATLKLMAHEFGYDLVHEGERVIGLTKGCSSISLEPGGQVELSAEPIPCVHQSKRQVDEFFSQLRFAAESFGNTAWLATGIHPFAAQSDFEWVPKKRYNIMKEYLGARGARAHDMMLRTATNQISFDYTSEQDAIDKMRLVLALTPIASALFANSSVAHGKVSGFAAERLAIWRETDPARCGMILDLICERCTFDDYLKYVLNVPMIFLVRDEKWIETKNLTFSDFIQSGFEGTHATLSDFELHLSTIFTDARFKQYLEIRGMDGQSPRFILAVYAFWKGILYSDSATAKASEVIRRFREEDIYKLHLEIEKLGLKAEIGGVSVSDLAGELVSISESGLKEEGCLNDEGQDERVYLEPVKSQILGSQKTPGEQVAELWAGPFKGQPERLIEHLKI